MKLEQIVRALNLKVRCCESNLSNEVKGGYVGDLLSDVMGNSREGDIWITRQIHQNIVAVAGLKEHAAIIIVQNAAAMGETVDKAISEGIPILESDATGFETAGKLYKLLYS